MRNGRCPGETEINLVRGPVRTPRTSGGHRLTGSGRVGVGEGGVTWGLPLSRRTTSTRPGQQRASGMGMMLGEDKKGWVQGAIHF